MRRIVAVILTISIVFAGCGRAQATDVHPEVTIAEEISSEPIVWENMEPEYASLDDAELLAHIEDMVYRDTVLAIDSKQYFVENVSTVYISNEYLAEVAFNSQSNIFFGYTLDELNELFQGTRYVFTLGENGETTVEALKEIEDVSTETMLKNIAIGTGVILVCVTISAVTPGVPAISAIFAASAKTGTTVALSSAAFGGITAGAVTGYQTGDINEAIKAATLAGSEGFKWGAIIGSISGGMESALTLKGATLNGLTMNEAATIQQTTQWPIEAIKSVHSMDEFNIYKAAGVTPAKVNGKWAFVRDIDWNLVDEFGRSNIQRVTAGLAPIDDITGMPFELHHIGQKADSPLAILSYSEHHGKGNFSVLHYADEGKNVANEVWQEQKQAFWQAILVLSGKVN